MPHAGCLFTYIIQEALCFDFAVTTYQRRMGSPVEEEEKLAQMVHDFIESETTPPTCSPSSQATTFHHSTHLTLQVILSSFITGILSKSMIFLFWFTSITDVSMVT